MGKFVIHLITALIWTGVLAGGGVALVYFGGPALWRHIQEGEAAKVTAHAQAGALAADTTAANRAQASCSTEVAHAMDAAKAIARASQVQPLGTDKQQPLITADQIKAMIQ